MAGRAIKTPSWLECLLALSEVPDIPEPAVRTIMEQALARIPGERLYREASSLLDLVPPNAGKDRPSFGAALESMLFCGASVSEFHPDQASSLFTKLAARGFPELASRLFMERASAGFLELMEPLACCEDLWPIGGYGSFDRLEASRLAPGAFAVLAALGALEQARDIATLGAKAPDEAEIHRWTRACMNCMRPNGNPKLFADSVESLLRAGAIFAECASTGSDRSASLTRRAL